MEPYIYSSKASVSGAVLAEWAFESQLFCETCVIPDGCRDFIIRESLEEGCTWFISDLSRSAYMVPVSAGERMKGIRLQPGVEIRLTDLVSWLHNKNPADLFGSDQIDEFCVRDKQLAVALDCLASGILTVQCAAKDLGISVRSLQRIVKSGTQRSPHFWLSLARIRRAGRSLDSYDSLSDAAFAFGFSDQAHMTREMKKWFNITPNQIKANDEIRALLCEPGYG
ncbi:MAG: AraC family transcriptional regulator [Leptolyngbya sp. SIO1E4]|nr:AraC family transcriptional regulator [Leptolyngbya sp. SIO1E4]